MLNLHFLSEIHTPLINEVLPQQLLTYDIICMQILVPTCRTNNLKKSIEVLQCFLHPDTTFVRIE